MLKKSSLPIISFFWLVLWCCYLTQGHKIYANVSFKEFYSFSFFHPFWGDFCRVLSSDNQFIKTEQKFWIRLMQTYGCFASSELCFSMAFCFSCQAAGLLWVNGESLGPRKDSWKETSSSTREAIQIYPRAGKSAGPWWGSQMHMDVLLGRFQATLQDKALPS